jgi:hypothetical protein
MFTRPTPTPKPTRTPRPTPTPTPDGEQPPPPGPGELDLYTYASGVARGSRPDDHWAFSICADQPRGGVPTGEVLIVSSIRNITYFGNITGGRVTQAPVGGGISELTGTLTTGQTFSVKLTDANSTINRDELEFSVSNGVTFSNGSVYHGVVRTMRARPEAGGTLPAPGFRFDSQCGLFMFDDDARREVKPLDEPVDPRVLEVTRPDPVFDFREDDLGGYIQAPGSGDNVPGAIVDDNSGSGSGSGGGGSGPG